MTRTRSGSWPSETPDPARDAEAAFTEALEGLSAAARAEPVPVDAHAVWLRLAAGLQGQSGENAKTRKGWNTLLGATTAPAGEPYPTWWNTLLGAKTAPAGEPFLTSETTKVAQSIISCFGPYALSRSLRVPLPAWRSVLAEPRRAMLAMASAACVAGGLVWIMIGSAPEMERVRIDASLWQRDPVAEEPMGETTDALIALLSIEES